jgi:homoserine kinase
VRLIVRAPATSANLGPGFDCFGLALDLSNEVVLDTEAEPTVSWDGEGADELPVDGTDLVTRALSAAVSRRGDRAEIPTFALYGENRIPLERGLGSSSAAAVAGAALGVALLGSLGVEEDPSAIFATAAELEGHPDNAAAGAFGGLTIVTEGVVRRFDVSPSLRPVVLVPDELRLPTAAARAALRDGVALGDAVFNVAHGALVVQALVAGDEGLLHAGMRDRLHEDARLELVPEVRRMLERLRDAEVPACLSGAGPSVLAFETAERTVPDGGEGWRTLRLKVRSKGVEVVQV